MKHIVLGILTLFSVLVNIILISSIDKLDTELRVTKLLFETNQSILEEYYDKQQIDSMYLDYSVYYQYNYYNENYK
jgi:hypothetical protein